MSFVFLQCYFKPTLVLLLNIKRAKVVDPLILKVLTSLLFLKLLLFFLISANYIVTRTCITQIQINKFMVNQVCMSESNRRGHLCFCNDSLCNSAITIASTTIEFTQISSSLQILFGFLLHQTVCSSLLKISNG